MRNSLKTVPIYHLFKDQNIQKLIPRFDIEIEYCDKLENFYYTQLVDRAFSILIRKTFTIGVMMAG